MTDTRKLEMAARVRGLFGQVHDGRYWIRTDGLSDPQAYSHPTAVAWLPDTDDGDSRRLEIACLTWMELTQDAGQDIADECWQGLRDLIDTLTGCKLSPESYRAAVLDLAAAIGKSMGGEQ